MPRQGVSVAQISGMAALWAESLGDERVCIAMLDGIVDEAHPAFKSASLALTDPLGLYPSGRTASEDPSRFAISHGTYVASLLFGEHEGDIKGVAPRCKGVVVPLYRHEHDEKLTHCSQSDLARAIEAAVEFGAHVINISAGELLSSAKSDGALQKCDIDSTLAKALRLCRERNVLVIAAAGNDGCDCHSSPAASRDVIAVGAMTITGDPLASNNWGREYQKNGILALGKDVWVAAPGDRKVIKSGTSIATPVVSGVAAVLLSLQLTQIGSIDTKSIQDILFKTLDRCDPNSDSDCRRVLVGRLNVAAALAAMKKGLLSMSNSSEISSETFSSPMHDPPLPASVGVSSPGRPAAAVVAQSSREPSLETAAAVIPYDCSCNKESQLVYAVGKLNYDLPLPGIQDSLNAMLGLPANKAGVQNSDAVIQYLLGGERNIDGTPMRFHGALADIDSVVWTLEQDGSPVYAIRPTRAFAAEAFKQLLALYIEQEYGEWPFVYSKLRAIGASPKCLYDYFTCFSGEFNAGWPPLPITTLLGAPLASGATSLTVASNVGFPDPPFVVDIADERLQVLSVGVTGLTWRVTRGFDSSVAAAHASGDKVTLIDADLVKATFAAFPGEIVGQARLRSGQIVEVISPVIRGTQNWATQRLLRGPETTTNGAINNAVTTMVVNSTIGFPEAPFDVKVENEQMNVTAIAGNTWTVARGQNGTTAAAHVTSSIVKGSVTADERDFYEHLVARLGDETRNPGRSPEERTRNFAATNALNMLVRLHNELEFRKFVRNSTIADIWVESIDVSPNDRCRAMSECFDFELKLFDGSDLLKGRFVVSATVDVKPVVPVIISDLRLKVVPR